MARQALAAPVQCKKKENMHLHVFVFVLSNIVAEFEVCPVSYRLTFSKHEAMGHESSIKLEKRGSVTCSTDREYEDNKMFIISL